MPVIANGGYYGAPGVTAAGAYGATAADMLYSLRNQGWSDQQIMDTYGPDDPMVRIMQLENQYNQMQPGTNGYRYQYPQPAPAPAPAPAQPPYNPVDGAFSGAMQGAGIGAAIAQSLPPQGGYSRQPFWRGSAMEVYPSGDTAIPPAMMR